MKIFDQKKKNSGDNMEPFKNQAFETYLCIASKQGIFIRRKCLFLTTPP
jgi:hypothetical protein